MCILICDDNAPFAAKVAEYVEDYYGQQGIRVKTTVCTSGEQVLKVPELENYKMAVLDGDMPGMDGISLGRELKCRNPEMLLIYVSAYLIFAKKGYTVDAYRYVQKQDFEVDMPGVLDDALAKLCDRKHTLTVHCNREVQEIPLDQIYYLESDLRLINVYGDIAHTPICSYYAKLSELPDSLYEDGFLQVSRSDVVNMKYIRRINNYRVEMRNGVELSVTRKSYAAIRGRFLEWKGQFGDE